MVLSAEKVTEQAWAFTLRDDQDSEIQVEDVYRTAVVELPPVTDRGWQTSARTTTPNMVGLRS